MRTNAAARLRNRQNRAKTRSMEKSVLVATDAASAVKDLVSAYKVLDQMASKGVVHPNTAARHKAKLARKVKTLSATV